MPMEAPAQRWNEWLEAANYAFKRGAYAEAVELYSGALGDASTTSIPAAERAKLLANRAFAHQRAGAAHQVDVHAPFLYTRACVPRLVTYCR